MDYTITVKRGTFDKPIGTFDPIGRVVYNKFEHYDIDVADVVMETKVRNEEDVKVLAEELYPEIISILGDNEYAGVRIGLDRVIKTLFHQGESLKEFQRSLLLQYSAMRLDIDIVGLTKEDL